ncbi:MAG: hypothetical protein MO853_13375 [Candidatus Protistobacter heckmanni]|nr:hypothetical protein [Candidatus Protistobacter heckmanni]
MKTQLVSLMIRSRISSFFDSMAAAVLNSSASRSAVSIKMLGKAFYWKRLIDEGVYPTTADLARALKLEPGWAAEVLRMTMLAPDIVEAIFEGRQPRHLNLHTLRGRQDLLPSDWAEQRRLLSLLRRLTNALDPRFLPSPFSPQTASPVLAVCVNAGRLENPKFLRGSPLDPLLTRQYKD